MVEYDKIESYGIPGFEGEWYSFIIEGNSMEPILFQGEMIISQKLHSLKEIINNKIYVIINDEGFGKVKFVNIPHNENGDLSSLILISKNNIDYPNIEKVSIENITSIFRVIKK